MKLRKLLVVLFVLVCVVSLACFTACKDEGAIDDGSGDQNIDAGNTDNGNNNGDVGDNTGNDNTGDNNQTPDVGGDNNETPDVGGDNTGDNNETPDVGGDNNETPDIGGDDNGDNGENPDIGGDDNGEEPETPAVVLDSISAVYNGSDITVNGILDSTLIFVTAYYTNETNSAVATFVVGDFDSSVAGVKEVTISYTEGEITKTTTINVTVVEEELEEPEVVLDSISAVYGGEDIIVGGTLDNALISVIATYSDTNTAPVTDFSVTGFDSTTAGEKEVTISYTEGDVTKTTTITITVIEEEPEMETVKIYYYNGSDWTVVNAYVWSEEIGTITPGANSVVVVGSFCDWDVNSGAIMSYNLENSEYYINGLQLSANTELKIAKLDENGVVLTPYWADLKLGEFGVDASIATWAGGDANVVITSDGIYDIYYKVAGDDIGMWIAPAGEAVTPNQGVISTLISEAWPGSAMTAVEGQDGWYYIEVNADAEKVIFNDGVNQTDDLILDGTNYYYNGTEWTDGFNVEEQDPEDPGVDPEDPGVDPEDPGVDPEQPGVDPEDPEVDPEQPEVSGTTIYFKSENGWTNANIWAWEGQVNHTGGTWPGAVMSSEGNGWFSYTFAEGIVPTNIIFNNGTAQTANLVFDGTNNYYAFNTMTGGTWGTDNTVSAPVQESDCYLRGDVGVGENDWGIGKAMTYNGTDEYSITVTVDAGAEVKIVYQNNWIGSELLKAGIEVAIEKPAGGNIKFTEAGTYTIYYKVTGDNTGIWIAAVEAEA